MLRVWVHGCDPGRVSDGSRLALYAKLSLSNALRLSFSGMCILLFLFLSLCRFCLFVFFFYSHSSLVDVPLIFCCPADHVVPDWQPHILRGIVEARSVNVKKTASGNLFKCHEEVLYLQPLIPPKRFDIFSPITGGCSEGLGGP